ncbi:MAG: Gfo/Idh/MocA family oxidoreductase [Coxiellaceae bacterium]|nr:Gfo/Idh/MocA family oxidoreductase [Coxiellaceae bacterium]
MLDSTDKQKPLRWGLLGTSFISGVIAEAIQQSESGSVIAIGGRNQQKADAFANQHSIPHAYGDYSDLLLNADIDVIYIGLPTHLHAEWTIKSAQANKHILCEKPFALNADEAKNAIAAVKQANVFCMEAQMYRCHPLIKQLQQVMTENSIGQLRSASAVFADKIIHLVNPTTGSSILDLGCYPLSLLRLIFGEPEKIIGHVHHDDTYNMVDTAKATVVFPNNCSAMVTVCSSMGLYWHFKIFGTDGYIDVSNLWQTDSDDTITIHKYDNTPPQVICVNSDKSFYVDQINTVTQHILNNEQQAASPAMSWQDSLMNTQALDLWQAAAGSV